ncbi:MAG TPA: HAD-IA family hydrolase [Pseudomonadales bacterium]
MRNHSIRAVLFDADGVVQRAAPGWRDALAALSPDPASADAFCAAVFAAERPCLTGAGDFRSALAEALETFGCGSDVEEALRVWTLIDPVDDVLAVARRLRARGLITGLATNQQSYRAAYMSERLGYRSAFDHLFYSCELGHAKPSAGFFRSALANLALPPSQVLFLDDHPDNVAAARQVGLCAEQFHADQGATALWSLLAARGVPPD